MRETVLYGAHIGKTASGVADSKFCTRFSLEEEQTGILLGWVCCFLLIGINVIENRFAGLGMFLEIIDDLDRLIRINMGVPGQPLLFLCVPVLIGVNHC